MTERKYAFKYSATINFLCDVIADVVEWKYENALQVENGAGAPPNSPDWNPVDYSIWRALQQLVYRRRRIRDVEHLKEVLQTCWEQIGQDVIDSAIRQFRQRLSLVATSGGHIEHRFD